MSLQRLTTETFRTISHKLSPSLFLIDLNGLAFRRALAAGIFD